MAIESDELGAKDEDKCEGKVKWEGSEEKCWNKGRQLKSCCNCRRLKNIK